MESAAKIIESTIRSKEKTSAVSGAEDEVVVVVGGLAFD